MSLSYERRTDASPTCAHSFLLTMNGLSSAERINQQSTYRLGVADRRLLCWSSLLLQAHLSVAFVCLKSYIGCVFVGSSESEPTSVHQLIADTRRMPSHI